MSFFAKTRSWYGRFERPISSLSLLAGFIFDAVTLRRVDALWENLWIFGHIVLVSIFMALIHLRKSEEGDEKNPSKAHFWYVNILQFLFGGILSAFLVFYFRSTDIWTTWPFLAILAFAFIANESFKKHYVRLSFQISLLFLSIYSFTIYFIPVILHEIGMWIFILSGVISLLFIFIFIIILFHFIKDKIKEHMKMMMLLILGIFISINILYFTNLIPPIPLSLKDGGVYHSVVKNGEGNYDVTYEDNGWIDYFKLYQDYRRVAGTPIYAFSAVFSPADLDMTIVHEWQYYDKSKKKWITDQVINLGLIGGREGGFRTYSMRSNLASGKWRVNIKTTQGQTIGCIRFNLMSVDTEPIITNEVK